jgi:hypothetical protein
MSGETDAGKRLKEALEATGRSRPDIAAEADRRAAEAATPKRPESK